MKKHKILFLLLAMLVCACSDEKYYDHLSLTSQELVNSYAQKIDGHAYVDLGLPSGLLWATCNVGASKAEDYGDYYEWGETSTKSGYAYYTSTTYSKTIEQLTTAGIIGSDGNLTSAYDAASKSWGGTWRMPTLDEIKELIDNTTTTWTTLNGVKGCKVTSKTNGNSIFVPAAGYRDGASLYNAGWDGYYWSSSLYTSVSLYAYYLSFNSSYFYWNNNDRYYGKSVRPVSSSVITPAKTEVLFSTTGGTMTIGIEANCTWSATSSASWLTCTKNSNTELALTAANTSDTERTAIVSIKDERGIVKATISVKPYESHNGHEYVDLGLPSGLLWATCNVGASTPEDYGGYYAWGETDTKSDYSVSTSTTDGKNTMELTANGIIGSDGNLTAAYDVATKVWGGTWRMPTLDDIKELIQNTTTTWATLNGVDGRKVTSKTNGNSIFLPAAGYRDGTSLNSAGYCGNYSSSSPNAGNSRLTYCLFIRSDNFVWNYGLGRCYGYSVRPVSGSVITPAKTEVLFSTIGGADTIGIKANCTWTATSSASWLTCTKNSDTELALTATENTASTERTATVSIKDEKGTVKATIFVKQQKTNKISGHEYVDLGLPSGLLWATCNVGASKAEYYGNYYAWGETSTKSDYSESTSTTYRKSIEQLKSAGIIGSDGNLTASYDAARKAWGGTWRMPTFDEIKELIDNTTTTWTTQNSVYGRKVTSKTNGNSIFLPAAGYRDGTSLNYDGSNGYYWSSSPSTSYSSQAYFLIFYSSNFDWNYRYSHYCGQSVRPVSEP